ncbi:MULTISPECIES: DUF1097 domain-containing protein [unclassified Acidovorax]|uniref:DUF1097 domain-containing protein n=1 Tax=unclassified Acidovorax TaxID=2684926 RepID=UPI000BD780EE|nr:MULTISPECIES: DUF1097 domain-containing protein [unclassified Acidovorax]OZA57937.1 MAG: hypothetical protein B7X79_04655 [Acidovorax sp. 17-64-282]HQS65476.1 DUF1097 domain-containing protein [Acidovorax defluvii]OYY26101.1 MAG: hypothetical protein B7Y64_17160 [Acidovorax sp. 35-64-16]OYY85270.1 MAG: hypothetical protein B7Y46_09930 [Acidovorax sp. 28-64-14]OZA67491.1 MAG: hypothetical protein B7X70_17180 [Acidovorax sp. 39-64-12]
MKLLHTLALSIAALVAVWVYLSIGRPELRLNPWIGFVSWAAFFAAGGGSAGALKSVAGGIAAILLTAATMATVAALGGGLPWLIGLVAVLAFVLVAMADVPVLAYTPAAFLGAASFFGAGAKADETILLVSITWVAGVAFGFASELIGKRVAAPAV